MSERSQEIALEVMAQEEQSLLDYLADYRAGKIEADFVIACIGEIVEKAVGNALDGFEE